MSDVKRYHTNSCDCCSANPGVTPDEYGDYVRFDDYATLRAELDRLRKASGEAVGAQWQDLDGTWRYPMSDKHLKDTAEAGYPTRALYTHPDPQDDARDAERYRFQRDRMFRWFPQTGAWELCDDAGKRIASGVARTYESAIDAAILAAKEKGEGK